MKEHALIPLPLKEIRNALESKEIRSIGMTDEETLLIGLAERGLLIAIHQKRRRCHLTEREPHIQSVFTKELEHRLSGATINDLCLQGTALVIRLFKNGKSFSLIAEFSTKKRNIFLMDGEAVLLSLRGSPKSPFRLSRSSSCTFDESRSSVSLDREYQFTEDKEAICRKLLIEVERLKKTLGNLERERERCLSWKDKEKEALLLQANIYRIERGQKTLEATDWESGKKVFIPVLGRNKEESLRKAFLASKRLKRGLGPIEEKIQTVQDRIEKKTLELKDASSATTQRELSPFKSRFKKEAKKELTKKKESANRPYKEYLSESGYLLLVGKSKKENDQLTFQVASPHDLWLHVSDFPGSHVVIRLKKNEEPDKKTIDEAAHLAVEFSQAKGQSAADITLTKQKNLRRIKGKPGQVMVREKRVLRLVIKKETLEAVLKRKPL